MQIRLAWLVFPAALVAPALPALGQIGSGWTPITWDKRVHLDDEAGLQIFNWSPSQQVGIGTPCADYTYTAATDTERFRIFDSRSNRSEIRLLNNYNTGIFQFEGYVKFNQPVHDESLFQIFGSSGDAATFLMMRGYRDNGGEIRVMGGSHTIASGVYGQEVRINVIHEQNVSAKFYVNGQFLYEQPDTDTAATNYWKYGCYGSTNGNVPAVVDWRAVRTFTGGTSSIAPPPGAYEAEFATLGGAVVANNVAGFTGSGFADYKNLSGDYINWTVNVEKAGLYDLDFRYAMNENRPLAISINGQTVKPSMSFPSTGAITTWKYATLGLQSLHAGTNAIRATAIGFSGANVDHLVVDTLQAEDATLGGAVVDDGIDGATGSGFVDFKNASGDYVEWAFDLAAGGLHDLNFRYALGSGNRPLQVKLNGQIVSPSLSFPATGDLTEWAYATLPAQLLLSGNNTVRLTAIGSSGANIDTLLLSPVPEPGAASLLSIASIALLRRGRRKN